jgi:cytidylate kinase
MSMTETHHLNLTDPAVVGDQPVIITITRDFGAEGHEIGKLLSLELGIPLYDNELVVRAARRVGMTEGQVAAYDEQSAGEMAAFLPDRCDPRTTSDQLFDAMRQIILDLGSTQTCIIEGRLSDYILRDNPNLLNVLVTASFDDRVRIVRTKRHLSKKKGAKLVRHMQRSREEFYKRYSAGAWHYHDGKHLVVDRSAFGREGCCAIIACAFRQKLTCAKRPDVAS